MRRAAAAARSTRAPSSGSSKGESRKALGPQAPATSRSSQRRSNDAVAVSDSAAYRARAVRSGPPADPGASRSVCGFSHGVWRPASVTGFGNKHPRSEQSAVSIWCPDALAACQELAGQRNEWAEFIIVSQVRDGRDARTPRGRRDQPCGFLRSPAPPASSDGGYSSPAPESGSFSDQSATREHWPQVRRGYAEVHSDIRLWIAHGLAGLLTAARSRRFLVGQGTDAGAIRRESLGAAAK